MKTLTLKKIGAFAVLCAVAAASLFAADGFGVTIDASASLLTVRKTDLPSGSDPDAIVTSLIPEDGSWDDSEIKFTYDGENYGGTITLGFYDYGTPFLEGTFVTNSDSAVVAFDIFDEVSAWAKPFGNIAKFTLGIGFDNTDGIAIYDDIIDNYDIGVWTLAKASDGYLYVTEPLGNTTVSLDTGLLCDLSFGSTVVQLLFGPNYDKNALNALGGAGADFKEGLFQYGARIYTPITGVGTFAVLYKIAQRSSALSPGYLGNKVSFNTFGLYADITAITDFGIAVGYTGFLPVSDYTGAESVLWSGIDLRGTFTGIDRVALALQANVSFAQGNNKDVVALSGNDLSWLTYYGALAADIDLGKGMSLVPEVNYVHRELVDKSTGGNGEFGDTLGVKADFKKALNDHASIKCGIAFSLDSSGALDNKGKKFEESITTETKVSVPVGVTITW